MSAFLHVLNHILFYGVLLHIPGIPNTYTIDNNNNNWEGPGMQYVLLTQHPFQLML